MRTKLLFKLAAVAISIVMAGCMEGDKFDPDKVVIVMTGTEINPVRQFVVEEAPAAFVITASVTDKVRERTVVTFAIDTSLVHSFNKKTRSNYFAIPGADAVQLEGTQGVFEVGQTISSGVVVRVLSTDAFVDGRIYMIPVTITSVSGGDLELLEASRTAYLRISRTYTFSSLDLHYSDNGSNTVATNAATAPYGEYWFPEDKHINLNNGYTFEIKVYINQWHPSTSPGYQISRLCNFDTGVGNMLRFGEDGMEISQLQWISPGGNVVSETRFSLQQWYLISLVYNGYSFTMYVDGVKDKEVMTTASSNITFKAIEIGMSWVGTYRQRQRFLGKICEMRVWDHARSANQIQMGLCYVDPTSQGLRAYWKFNEGEGHIFHDATGNGYDMDWSNVWRVDHATSESAPYSNVNLSSRVRWNTNLSTNVCNP